jgi:hypothetical protein
LLKMKLWLFTLVVALSSAPAWALPSRDGAPLGKQKLERNASSIRLSTAQRAELSVLSQRRLDVPPALEKRVAASRHGGIDAKPRHDRARLAQIGRSRGEHWHGRRGHRGSATPTPPTSPQTTGVDAAPIPEPSALLCFGVGLLAVRRSIGRARSR